MSYHRILCIGEAAVDFYTNEEIDLNQAKNFQKRLGGEAALAAKIASLGHECIFLSKVGNDKFGLGIKDKLQEAGVDISALSFDDNNETTVTFSSPKDKVYLTKGADRYLDEKDVGIRVLENVDLLHFDTCALYPYDTHCLANILKWSLKKNIYVAFSLEPSYSLNNKDIRKEVNGFLAYAQLLCLSAKQASMLTGVMGEAFAIESLLKENMRLQQVIIRNNEKISLYTRQGKINEDILASEKEDDFLASYLSYWRLGDSESDFDLHMSLTMLNIQEN